MELDKAQIHAISELGRQFSDATIHMHEAIANKAGLTGIDHKYLGYLIRHGAMTAGQFAKYTGLTSGAVTGLIDRLEKKNLVKREFDPADRRKIIIVPNKENTTKLLGASFKKLQNKIVSHISTIPDHERIVIEKYLLATIEIMNDIRKNLNNNEKS